MVKVSICVPAYNQPDCLRRALESIRAQSFQDYEVIITDDSTNSLVQEMAGQFLSDSRFRYFKNPERKGTPGNWNEGIRLSNGSIIKILHHDDWFISEDCLAEFVKLLDENPEAEFAFSASIAFDSGQHRLFEHRPSSAQIAELAKNSACLFWGNFVGAPSATIFRKQDRYFDEQLKWLVDIDFYIRVLNSNSHFVYSEKPLVGITAASDYQVTSEVSRDVHLQLREYMYLYRKLRLSPIQVFKAIMLFRSLLGGFGLSSLKQLHVPETETSLPIEMHLAIYLEKLHGFLRKTATLPKRALSKLLPSDPKPEPQNSYSQCGEDLIVNFIFMWLKIDDIYYLDIGAHHPTWLSNTYFFYRKGCHGVLVEADPYLCEDLRRKRPRDNCLNIGVGIGAESAADFYVMTSRTLNTFSKEEAYRYQSYGNEKIEQVVKVPLLSVNEVILNHCEMTPNLISIDIEGMDLLILENFNFELFRPAVICVETITYTENFSERKIPEIVSLMLGQDYFVYADTYINTIFVDRKKWLKRA